MQKAVDALHAAMRQRAGNAPSCTAACRQLAEMTYRNADAQMLVGRAGLLEDVGQAMERHAGDAELQEAACLALAGAAADPLNGNRAAELLPAVGAAMRGHVSSLAVQDAACRALAVVTAQPKSRHAAARVRPPLLGDIQAAMGRHRRVATLQEAACSAISNAVLDCPAAAAWAVKLGLAEDIRAAESAHTTAPKVVDRAQAALERLIAAASQGGASAEDKTMEDEEVDAGEEDEEDSEAGGEEEGDPEDD